MSFLVIAIVAIVVLRALTRGTAAQAAASPIKCATCGYDLRVTPERCPECGTLVPRFRRPLDPAKLREEWPLSPIEPRVPGLEETLVRVWDAPHSFAANLLVEQFRARGIRASVTKQTQPIAVGNTIAPPADFSVAVWSGDAPAAEEILTRLAYDAPSHQ